jgi:serine/threonine protein kinase
MCPASVGLAVVLQAAEAVGKLHAGGVAHGDIKLDNFVLNEAGQASPPPARPCPAAALAGRSPPPARASLKRVS